MNALELKRTRKHYEQLANDAHEAGREEYVNELAWEAAHMSEIKRCAKKLATDDNICERFNEQLPAFYERLRQCGQEEDYAEVGRLVWGTIWAEILNEASNEVRARLEPVTIERGEHPSLTAAERNNVRAFSEL